MWSMEHSMLDSPALTVVESGGVETVADLIYAKQSAVSRLVLAAPESSSFQRAEDFSERIIATELVNVTKNYFQSAESK